ncbi:MAG: glycosyltransferase [Clostridiales bacterium]|nr:glycosyltransferase [Clostridiales bacterium]
MKKLFIAFEWLHMGGTEKFILDAISLLPKDEYQVDLFLIHEEGPYLQYLPSDVRLVCPFKMGRVEFDRRYAEIAANYSTRACLKRKKYGRAIFRYIANKFNRDRLKRFGSLLSDVDTELKYDIVIGASMTQLFSTAVASAIDADRKYLWVHMPFADKRSKNFVYFNAKYFAKYVDKFDGIVCVSNGIKQMVRSAMPNYKGFVTTMYNYFDVAAIKTKAQEQIAETLDGDIKIVSVGRVESQKGFDIAIEAAKILQKNGNKFVWYIIGDGKYRAELTKRAEKLGLNDCFVFLGRHNNPYPYMRMCDIYCQPSRYEAFCTTIIEALVLEKPIVATDFTGIDEQIIDGQNGLIVNKTPKGIAFGLEKMFNAEFRSKLASNADCQSAYKRGVALDKGYLDQLNNLCE